MHGRAWAGGALRRGSGALQTQGIRAAATKAASEVRAWLAFGHHRMWGQRSFVFDGYEHPCLVHLYNRTWTNERAVEIPLARAFLAGSPGPALEIGNVLAHYCVPGHTVIDKYEDRPGVLNVDVVDYHPAERFGAIVCISTLEQVGWDETPCDPAKIRRAIVHLRSLLLPFRPDARDLSAFLSPQPR